MYSSPQIAKARDQYRSTALASRIEGSGPHGLVTLLYEELSRSLEVVALCMERDQNAVSRPHVDRARSILLALEAGLDFQQGAGLALQLPGIYRAMRTELQRCLDTKDVDGMAKLRQGLTDIAASWADIAAR